VETVGWEGRGVGMWQADTSRVVAPRLGQLRTVRLVPRASIERTDHMPVIWA
jgi:hypothetical protein